MVLATRCGVSGVPAYWLLDLAGEIVSKVYDPDELAPILTGVRGRAPMGHGHLTKFLSRIRETVAGPDGLTDAVLLKRFTESRDEAAFELLLRRHERLVLGVCRRNLRNAHATKWPIVSPSRRGHA